VPIRNTTQDAEDVQPPNTRLRQLGPPSYPEIATRSGESVSLVAKVMRGERRPNLAIRAAVEELAGVPARLDDLR
jgi:transcriptional regulator with XRE-family HTH domain